MPTIGVALPVPDPWGRELQDYRVALGDAAAGFIPSHVTLIPPTEVTESDLEVIEQHLAEVAAVHPAFTVRLRGTGTFRPVSPVVFVMLAEGISACEQLASALRRGPLGVELAFPYHPHVTVAHHLPDSSLDQAFAELAAFECVFDVSAFHLYLHDDDRGWRPAREFALAAAPALA